MNAFILMLPFFFVRLIVLPVRNRAASSRAAESAPLYTGGEKFAGNLYQLTSVAIFIYPVLMRVEFDFSWQLWLGAVLYVLGIVLLTASVIAFANPDILDKDKWVVVNARKKKLYTEDEAREILTSKNQSK